MIRSYLDHASTTPLRPEARIAIQEWADGAHGFADPGRVHHDGLIVRELVERSRQDVADLLGVSPRQVIFTSGGTESINHAVWGAALAHRRRPILCSGVEHSSVRNCSARAAEVVALGVDPDGRISVDELESLLGNPGSVGQKPALVHCQVANHEVGTIQPLTEIAELCRRHGVWLHSDACAAAGHMALDFDQLGSDMMSISSHKLGGPPGIGALILRRGLRVAPLVVGGEQERGRRGGFENILGIVGFAAAARSLSNSAELEQACKVALSLTETALRGAMQTSGVAQLGDTRHRLPHLICLTVDGVEAEAVLLGLDRAGISVHSGSACASESLSPSPVLEAMGSDSARSLRVSVGWTTTDRDITAFIEGFSKVVADLRALRSTSQGA